MKIIGSRDRQGDSRGGGHCGGPASTLAPHLLLQDGGDGVERPRGSVRHLARAGKPDGFRHTDGEKQLCAGPYFLKPFR